MGFIQILSTSHRSVCVSWDLLLIIMKYSILFSGLKQQQQPFYSPCLGLSRWASTRRNIHLKHLFWSSIIFYQLPRSSMIDSFLPVQLTCFTVFAQPLQSGLVYLLVWNPPLCTEYISSPNCCLLFATHAHTIAACFAVVPRLCRLFLVSLSMDWK